MGKSDKQMRDLVRKIKAEANDCTDCLQFLRNMPDSTTLKDIYSEFEQAGTSLERLGKLIVAMANVYEQQI